MSEIVCIDCKGRVTRHSKTGRCRTCANIYLGANPEFRKARAEGIRRKFRDDPSHVAKMKIIMRENVRKARLNPDYRQWLHEHGKRQVPKMFTPEALANKKASQAETGRKISEAYMAWCPPHYRDEYRRLTISKHFRSAEAKAIINDHIKRDRARLSPFERQDADLKAKLERHDEAPLASNDMFRRRAA